MVLFSGTDLWMRPEPQETTIEYTLTIGSDGWTYGLHRIVGFGAIDPDDSRIASIRWWTDGWLEIDINTDEFITYVTIDGVRIEVMDGAYSNEPGIIPSTSGTKTIIIEWKP